MRFVACKLLHGMLRGNAEHARALTFMSLLDKELKRFPGQLYFLEIKIQTTAYAFYVRSTKVARSHFSLPSTHNLIYVFMKGIYDLIFEIYNLIRDLLP